MVNNSAIVSIIEQIISNSNSAPCKKTLQKIVFLIEKKNVNIGCDYGIHFYGPYSSDLDFAVRKLCDEGILKIDYTPTEHRISVIDGSVVDKFNNETASEIVKEFSNDSPSELELIATALYVYTCTHDKEKIKSGVVKIKGNKYTDVQIDGAINRLIATNFIVEN